MTRPKAVNDWSARVILGGLMFVLAVGGMLGLAGDVRSQNEAGTVEVTVRLYDLQNADDVCEARILGPTETTFRTRTTSGGVRTLDLLPGEYTVEIELITSNIAPNGHCIFEIISGAEGDRIVIPNLSPGTVRTGSMFVEGEKTCQEKLEEMNFECPHCCEEEFGDPVPKNDMMNTSECQKLRECKDCDGDGEKEFGSSSDGCSFVPNSPFGFDFKSACDLHDRLYRTCYDLEDGEDARHRADRRLRNKLQSACTPEPGSSLGTVLLSGPSCGGLSVIYTQVVEAFNEPNFSDVERYRSTIRRAAIDEFGNPGEVERVCNEFYPEDSTSQRTCRKIAEGSSVEELSDEESRRASFMFRALEDFRRVANLTFFEQNQACCRQGDLQCLN